MNDLLLTINDQDRISPYIINTELSRQVRRIKKKTQLGDQKLIQYQILQIEIRRILCQTVGRITNPPSLTLLNSAGELLHPCSLENWEG